MGHKTPDRIGVQLGYRRWTVRHEITYPAEKALRPQGIWKYYWEVGGPTVARCAMGACREGFVPSFNCHCGLYARYSLGSVEGVYWRGVQGALLAWGRIVHHKGQSFFRAEKALPIGFVNPFSEVEPPPQRSIIHLQSTLTQRQMLMDKLEAIAESLEAPIFETGSELIAYAEAEEKKW